MGGIYIYEIYGIKVSYRKLFNILLTFDYYKNIMLEYIKEYNDNLKEKHKLNDNKEMSLSDVDDVLWDLDLPPKFSIHYDYLLPIIDEIVNDINIPGHEYLDLTILDDDWCRDTMVLGFTLNRTNTHNNFDGVDINIDNYIFNMIEGLKKTTNSLRQLEFLQPNENTKLYKKVF